MRLQEIKDCFERSPVIAAVPNNQLQKALESPVEIIFGLKVSLLDIEETIKKVHSVGKKIFIHIDLADGIGKDKTGVEYLAKLGVDGIISTRAQLIRFANEVGLVTVLVMSGETTTEILENSSEKPDIVLPSGKELLEIIK